MIKFAVATAFVVALTQAAHATPVTGIIQFSGSVDASVDDAVNATAGTKAFFNTTTVSFANGSFTGIVANGDPVTLFNNSIANLWTFNSGAIAGFWSVDGFTFDLTSSTFSGTTGSAGSGSATVVLAGTVSGNGFTANNFLGSFTLQDPSAADGRTYTYSGSFALGSVPDGGTTILLLGSALSGLALLKRKLVS